MAVVKMEATKALPTTCFHKGVVLVNPNWRICGISDSVRYFPSDRPVAPLELLYITGSLERKGIPVYLLDLWMTDSDIKQHQEVLKDCAYVVITTAPTYLFWRDGATEVRELADIIKAIKVINPKIKSILIGPQGTSVPQMVEKDNVDFIIRGEPDLVLADFIVEDLSYAPDYSKIDGICYRSNTGYVYSSKPAVVNDMSQLPILEYPDECLIGTPYTDFVINGDIKSGDIKSAVYEASRGCIFSCVYCWRDGFRDKLRTKKISQIEQEISSLARKGVQYVYFADETFGCKPNWTYQVLDILKKYEMKWSCQTNVKLLNTSLIDKISECGCIGVDLGLETIDTDVMNNIQKRFNLDKAKENIESLLSRNMGVKLFLIFGAPGDRKHSSCNIYSFLKDI
ncbi:MAG: radical SAM protein, partial [Patescibacteria group bacterium]|nr:radical SAM protein [Patescibacteria group bacterium]